MKGALKDKFEDYAPLPSKDLWEGIAEGIEPVKKRPLWAVWAVAAAAALLITSTIFVSIEKKGAKPALASSTQHKPSQPSTAAKEPSIKSNQSESSGVTLEHSDPSVSKANDLSAERSLSERSGRSHSEVALRQPSAQASQDSLPASLFLSPDATDEPAISSTKQRIIALSSVDPVPASADLWSAPQIAEVKAPFYIIVSPNAEEQPDKNPIKLNLKDLEARKVLAFASYKMEQLGISNSLEDYQSDEKEGEEKQSLFRIGLDKLKISPKRNKQRI